MQGLRSGLFDCVSCVGLVAWFCIWFYLIVFSYLSVGACSFVGDAIRWLVVGGWLVLLCVLVVRYFVNCLLVACGFVCEWL